MTLFRELVEKRSEDPRGRLTRLIKYTKGDLKEIIKHCVQQPAADGYDNAKKLLQQKYGNPYIIMSMMNSIMNRHQSMAPIEEW